MVILEKTMEEMIGVLVAECDTETDRLRSARATRAKGNKYHKLSIMLAEAQKFAKAEGL